MQVTDARGMGAVEIAALMQKKAFDECGFTAQNDPMRLDSVGVGDGIACESLP